MRSRITLLFPVIVTLGACTKSASDPAVAPAPLAPAPIDAGANGALYTDFSDAAASARDDARLSCADLGTVKLPDVPGQGGSLQDLRIGADSEGALVTWERYAMPDMGDSSQVASAAFVSRGPTGQPDRVTGIALPAAAYASAVYSLVGPTTVSGKLDLFVYGPSGVPTFALYDGGAKIWQGVEIWGARSIPDALRTATLPISLREIAVGNGAPLALVSGDEAPCESYYTCQEPYAAAMQKGLPKSLRSLSMIADHTHSEVLHRGTVDTPKKPYAPAIASSGDRALALYRVDDAIEAAWLALDGKKQSGFRVASGAELGAPAIALADGDAYAMWAQRADKSSPYSLVLAQLDATGVRASSTIATGSQSAFAPALAVIGGRIAIAWMEGDDSARGAIKLAFVAPRDLGKASIELESISDVTGASGNRRDPELATDGDRLYLAWGDYTKPQSGVAMLRTLECSMKPRVSSRPVH